MNGQYEQEKVDRLKIELADLDRELVEMNGIKIKPSQCYRFETDPAHVLFNTNCPETLKEKINALMIKYLPHDEGSTPQ